MFHTNNLNIKHKVRLLNLASELQNVSKACKIMGVSRDTFYRYQELVETDGLEDSSIVSAVCLTSRTVRIKAPHSSITGTL